MHLLRPERPRGDRDREEDEDDRAPHALLLSETESLSRLRRDLRSPLAPVGLLAVENRVGGSWGAEAVTRGRYTVIRRDPLPVITDAPPGHFQVTSENGAVEVVYACKTVPARSPATIR